VGKAREGVCGRFRRSRHILVKQDTISLRNDSEKRSLQLHPAIAVDAVGGALLGLVSATFLP